jgi:hypothetical protein
MNANYHRLHPHVGTGMKIRVERSRPSTKRLNGYLMGLSEMLGVMHCFDDFEPDGYTVFRLEDVVSVRSNEYERHWDRMLSAEGLLGGLTREFTIDLRGIQTALESVNKQFTTMIIECEDDEEAVEDFYIGHVVSISDEDLSFEHFDALGRWEEEPSTIRFDEITLIQFETPYIKIFSKYLSEKPYSGHN